MSGRRYKRSTPIEEIPTGWFCVRCYALFSNPELFAKHGCEAQKQEGVIDAPRRARG
jgi:hypothetical protein